MSDAAESTTPDEQPDEQPTEQPDEQPTDAPVLPDEVVVKASERRLTWIPFAIYLSAWIALAVASGLLTSEATPEAPARWMPEYPMLVWAGAALAAAGPVLSLIVWLIARTRRAAEARRGLLSSAMIRGALMAVLGTAIWLGTLYAVEVMTTNGVLG